jgi:hypothetical protein
MIPDTIVANPSINLNTPIEVYISDNNDDIELFNVYLEFIIYRIKADIESYYQALAAAPDHEVKHVLSTMITKKEDMHDALISYRPFNHNAWFALAFDTTVRYPSVDLIPDTHFEPFQCAINAFHFAYRKEYESLKLFESVGRLSRLDADIRTLLESATEHQCRHILHLDAMFANILNAEASATGQSVSIGNGAFHNDHPLTIFFQPQP